MAVYSDALVVLRNRKASLFRWCGRWGLSPVLGYLGAGALL